jgi:hypothetical protein
MKLANLVFALMLSVCMNTAQAGLILDSNGQLMGATDVLVDGTLYDVNFVEGSCASVWTGCDEASDFVWQNKEVALLSVVALMEQVFTNSYDVDPSLTNGCSHSGICNIWGTYWNDYQNAAYRSRFMNYDVESSDAAVVDGVQYYLSFDSSSWNTDVNARWAVAEVPEPSTLAIFALGLMVLATRRFKK